MTSISRDRCWPQWPNDWPIATEKFIEATQTTAENRVERNSCNYTVVTCLGTRGLEISLTAFPP